MKTPSFKSFHRPQLMGDGHESRVHLNLNNRLHQFVAEHLKASGHAVFPQSSPHEAYISMEGSRWMEANRETLTEDVNPQMIDIYATGGIAFNVRLLHNYKPWKPIGTQPGEHMGTTLYGTINAEGDYEQSDADIIEVVREEYGFHKIIPAQVR